MRDLNQCIANPSPEKRALLERQLMRRKHAAADEQTIPRREAADTYPLSFAQQRLWFLDQLEPNSPLYNIPRAVRLSGVLNVEALQKALDTIVVRHEALRTTFISMDGIPAQVIAQNRNVTLSRVDLSAWPDADRKAEVQRRLKEEARCPFDLSSDTMLRATLLRLDAEEHVLLLVMHHIASDGWSMGILSREFSDLYRAYSTGEPSPLPEMPVQYADFAVWQRQWLQGKVLEAQLAYWEEQLAGFPPSLDLPADHPRPAIRTYRGARQSFMLSRTLSKSLKLLSRQENVTLFMTLLAAFKTLLYRYTGQSDIMVGFPIANRNRVEIEGLIGFFVNTMVMRTDLSGNPMFRELLGRVREVALEAYDHQDLPFEKLVEECPVERDLSRTPLFQVMFQLRNVPATVLELPGLTLRTLEVNNGTAKCDVSLTMTEEAEGLQGTLEYNTDLYDTSTITRMLAHFRALLEGISIDPETHLSDLPLLTDALPLTPHGKVDRRVLPAPDRAGSEMDESSAAPHTPMESLIAEIWQEVLGVDRVGVYDNFFDLGGHSLLSMQVVARLEKRLGLRINPRELILQTLGQLASSCDERMSLRQQSEPLRFTQWLWRTIKHVASR